MRQPTLRVVSDLHISDDPLDDFDDVLQCEFCRFLGDMSTSSRPFELVINGDFLDFVQAPPWEGAALSSTTLEGLPLSFTQEQSLAKLGAIGQRHAPVFEGLGTFLAAHEDNVVTILPGNHDPDFFFKRVSDRLKEMVCGSANLSDRLRVYLDQVYRPAAYPGVWIEHGHQHDPANAFMVDGAARWSASSRPVFKDRDGTERLLECMGTRFLVRFLNRLDRDYPYVDNVKPFSRFVKLFWLSTFVRAQGPLRAAAAVWSMTKFLARTASWNWSDFQSMPDGTDGARTWLGHWVEALSADERCEFMKMADEIGVPIEMPLEMYVSDEERAEELLDALGEHPERLDGWPEAPEDLLSIGDEDDALGLVQGFTADDTATLKRAASAALERGGVEVVVMGHTHQAVTPTSALSYVNTGCWTRYYRFADDEHTIRWPMLRKPNYELFPYQLNYFEVTPGGPPAGDLRLFSERLT
jgi:UDP-2,3-diacylglucosamine pyrophosphatase LpxH